MAVSNITPAKLAGELTMYVAQYTEAVVKAIARELDETSKAVLADIQANSPVATGKYKKGWRITREATAGGKISYTIHQKSKPTITHLLEFGHAKTGGGRVNPAPGPGGHIRPPYDRRVPAMYERIERIIRGGGQP